MTLSAAAYIEKNKLSTNKAWFVLLELTSPASTVIRICANLEDIVWPVTNGDTYLHFPFEIDEIQEDSKGEIPSFEIRVSNVTRVMESYLDAENGLVDSTIILRIVNSTHITTVSQGTGIHNPDPEVELEYIVTNCHSDIQWVHFTIGASNPWNKRFPRSKVTKNYCRYKELGGARCQYDGEETTCDRSLDTCRNVMNNSINFGGCPGTGFKGEYV